MVVKRVVRYSELLNVALYMVTNVSEEITACIFGVEDQSLPSVKPRDQISTSLYRPVVVSS
jgi:hypothetical protein